MPIYSEADTRSILYDLMETKEQYVKHLLGLGGELQTLVLGRERVRFLESDQSQYSAPLGFYRTFIATGAIEPSHDSDGKFVAIDGNPVAIKEGYGGYSALLLEPVSPMYETLRDMLHVDRKIQDIGNQYIDALMRDAAVIKDDLMCFKPSGYEILGFDISPEALEFLSKSKQTEDREVLNGLMARLKEASTKYDDYVKKMNEKNASTNLEALKEAKWTMDKGESNVDTDQET